VAELYSVPKLEELAADPKKAMVLNRETTRVLATIGITAVNALMLRQLEFAIEAEVGQNEEFQEPTQGRFLTVEEGAAILHCDPSWFNRNARRLPFVRRVSRKNTLLVACELFRWVDARKI
jgi:hypothetical protein